MTYGLKRCVDCGETFEPTSGNVAIRFNGRQILMFTQTATVCSPALAWINGVQTRIRVSLCFSSR